MCVLKMLRFNKNTKYHISCIGDPLIDVFLSKKTVEKAIIQNQPYIHDMNATTMIECGGSTNALVSASRLGVKPNFFVGCAGTDLFAEIIEEKLKQEAIDSIIHRMTNERTGSVVILLDDKIQDNNSRHFIVSRGASVKLREKMVPDSIYDAKILLFHGFTLLSDPERSTILSIIKKAHNKKPGIHIAFDPGDAWFVTHRRAEINQLFNHITIFLPNQHELYALTKTKNVNHAIMQLFETFPSLQLVVVTLGRHGSIGKFRSDKKTIMMPAQTNVVVKDATGAGDAYAGALLAALIKGNTLKSAMKIATKMAAYCISGIGAWHLPEKENEVEKSL